jgi:hypothetical protein
MRFMLFICTDDDADEAMPDDEADSLFDAYMAFGEEMNRRGVLEHGARLRTVQHAKTVRVRDGEVRTTEGPFAETKERVNGFYIVDCKDMDEAIDVASKIPGARNGSIEVRPYWDL